MNTECVIFGIAFYLLGLIVGFVLSRHYTNKHSIGNLRIDSSNDDFDPYLFLELNQEVVSFKKKKYAILKIKNENYIPRD